MASKRARLHSNFPLETIPVLETKAHILWEKKEKGERKRESGRRERIERGGEEKREEREERREQRREERGERREEGEGRRESVHFDEPWPSNHITAINKSHLPQNETEESLLLIISDLLKHSVS